MTEADEKENRREKDAQEWLIERERKRLEDGQGREYDRQTAEAMKRTWTVEEKGGRG